MTASNKKKSPTKHNTRLFTLITLAAICLLGGFVRFVHVINLDFPLNDGGPFYLMMQELQEASYTLPIFTAYNQMDIPFSYPPLGFYLGAGIGDLLKVDLLDVLRLLPAFISTLTIPAFFNFSQRIFKDDQQVLAATFGFAFLPTSFDWLIVGGGLTRALGYLFAILTLGQVHALITKGKNKHLLMAILFASLTILQKAKISIF
jgi:hypothetical protein